MTMSHSMEYLWNSIEGVRFAATEGFITLVRFCHFLRLVLTRKAKAFVATLLQRSSK